jgi:phosphotransferase family enzyme
MADPKEERVDGGINEVVRIGHTIRRPVRPWSESVHELLRELEARGFTGAPRFLGIDQKGREILSAVPGATPWPPGPELCRPKAIESAAHLLRQYHDAISGWYPKTANWQTAPVSVGAPEVICHNDLAPWNIITRDGRTVAFVDWDTAAPGPRTWDLAYLAYTMTPLAEPANLEPMGWPNSIPISERLTRLRDGYGCSQQQWNELITMTPRRVQAAYDTMRIWAEEDQPGWRAQWNQPEPWRHGAGFLRDLEYIHSRIRDWQEIDTR